MAKPNAWEPWITNMVFKTADEKNIKAAGLYAQANGAECYQKGVGATAAEALNIVKGIKDPSLFTTADDSKRIPVKLGADKYMVLKCADGELTARKGPTTLIGKLSDKMLVLMLTKDGANPGNVTCHTKLVVKLKEKKN